MVSCYFCYGKLTLWTCPITELVEPLTKYSQCDTCRTIFNFELFMAVWWDLETFELLVEPDYGFALFNQNIEVA